MSEKYTFNFYGKNWSHYIEFKAPVNRRFREAGINRIPFSNGFSAHRGKRDQLRKR